jgi:hypothetical protein
MLLVASQAAARSRGSDLAGRVRSLLMSRSRGRHAGRGAAASAAQRGATVPRARGATTAKAYCAGPKAALAKAALR